MSEFRFADRRRPRIALAVFFAIGSVVLGFLGLWVFDGVTALEGDLADKRAILERARDVEAEGTAAPAEDPRIYRAETPQEARSRFQTDMQALADAHGLEIEEIRAEEMTRDGGHVQLGLTLTGAIPEVALGGFLVAIGSAEPMVVAREISVRRARGRSGAGRERNLPVKVRVMAYAAE